MPPLNESPSTGRSGCAQGPSQAPAQGREYWRSLEHLADTPEFREFMHREFPAGATDLLDSGERRQFLKIMGASMALAGLGLAGCRRWPEEQIVPFANRPAGHDPGVPKQYATCMEMGGVATALLATSYDGRPVKLEGNPDHPSSNGAADQFAQASILDLYDPDRSRTVMRDGERSDWAEFVTWSRDHFKKARDKRGNGLAFLSEATSSPSVLAMKERVLEQFPRAKWYEYEPLCNDSEVAGAEMAFGMPHRTLLDLESAKTIVSLDSDILGDHRDAVRHIGAFARGRRVDEHRSWMNRLYVFESDVTLTGANADERAAVRSADIAVIAAYLAARILGDDSLRRFENDEAAKAVLTDAVRARLDHAVADLTESGRQAVVTAGPRQPAEVHLLVHLMNAALGAVGHTVSYLLRRDEQKQAESIRALASSKVDTLVILGGNPAYNAPADVDFAALLEKARTSIHLGDYFDETGSACDWHVNRAHFLESWGDARAWDGTYSAAQPLIEPLFGGRSAIELLALITDDPETFGQAIVQRTFADMIGGQDEPRWKTTLHDGLLRGTAFTRETPDANGGALSGAVGTLFDRWSRGRDGWEIVFAAHPAIHDGRFANNGWLQEFPDPLTRLTWDNAVLINPAEARSLGVETGDMVTVSVDGQSVTAAAMVLPGIAGRSATLHLGYGRTFEGRICTGAGFDFYPLRTSEAMGFRTGVSVADAGGSYVLATTQDHHAIDVNTTGGRGVQSRLPSLFREADLGEYEQHPDFAAHRTHVVHRLSMWEESNLEGAKYAWGMSVDLNSCVGCGACVVACQAENNIPIVGKEQVEIGREMHWMRIDRYFDFARPGGENGPYDPGQVEAIAMQPVMCMMCENAPCEQVCPVAATVHDTDGLNVMVYNRCVGTRYCSNNCPYKVRRFNYFDWHRRKPHREQPGALLHVDKSYFERAQATPDELMQLQFNPEVTVRMRGVMEKCTYCVQRITDAKIDAKNEYASLDEEEKSRIKNRRVKVPDGAITPACAQTCPAEAIVFGDLMDPDSRVSKLQRHKRSYEMLEELNVKARTKYMAKIRNPAGSTSLGATHDDDHSEAGAH